MSYILIQFIPFALLILLLLSALARFLSEMPTRHHS
jgi:hypothetical protein